MQRHTGGAATRSDSGILLTNTPGCQLATDTMAERLRQASHLVLINIPPNTAHEGTKIAAPVSHEATTGTIERYGLKPA